MVPGCGLDVGEAARPRKGVRGRLGGCVQLAPATLGAPAPPALPFCGQPPAFHMDRLPTTTGHSAGPGPTQPCTVTVTGRQDDM